MQRAVINLQHGQSSNCLNITLFDDTLLEENETFSIVLESNTLGLQLNPATTNLTILDDDCNSINTVNCHIQLTTSPSCSCDSQV